MSREINWNATFDTPEVIFEPQDGHFELRGRSMPEDPVQFYQPLISWFKSYAKAPNPSTRLIIDLEYFNSSSLKQLVLIISILESIAEANNQVKVEWHYDTGDELMEVKGLEIQSIVNLEFELVPKPIKI